MEGQLFSQVLRDSRVPFIDADRSPGRAVPSQSAASHGVVASVALWAVLPFFAPRIYAGIVILIQGALIVALVLTARRQARAQRALDERLRFERLLGELSADFVSVLPDRVDEEIGRWLSRVLELFRVDRAALVQFSSHTSQLRVTHVSDDEPGSPLATSYEVDELRACAEEIRQGRVVRLTRLADLPAKGQADRVTLAAAGVRSMLAAPLSVGGNTIGFLGLMIRRGERAWSDEEVHRLQLVSGVFANALVRRNGDRALRSSDALGGAVLASLPSRVAVLDRIGTIIRVNDAWLDAALVIGADKIAIGANYLDVCRAATQHEPAACEVVQGIESVLAGKEPAGFRHEYASSSPAGEHWYELVVEPLRRPQGGAVVTLTDSTTRKRAEVEAQMHRAEAAHASRAATLGELAAGLAHELNQPLAAILTNVQASRRLLTSQPPRIEVLREILDDIAADDVRAAEIIRRMRALLKKGPMDVQPLDLNELTGDVLRLVASDAILRRVRVHPQLEPDLPGITGDRVQLQQVILNLVVNGLEAMSDTLPARRHLVIRTAQPEESWVEITVRDHGPGISAEALSRIYEPFFSTKRDGLGMGLSICRSIAEAHGGRLQASNHPDGGATVAFGLPVAGMGRRTDSAGRQERRSYARYDADSLRR